MARVTYICECGNSWKINIEGKIPFTAKCPKCDKDGKRSFKNITADEEDNVVAFAKRRMMFSALPSGQDRGLI